VERAEDQAMLANRAQWDSAPEVRAAALARLHDTALLRRILAGPADEEVRLAARRRLEALLMTDGEAEGA
jgi:hypothetical protein